MSRLTFSPRFHSATATAIVPTPLRRPPGRTGLRSLVALASLLALSGCWLVDGDDDDDDTAAAQTLNTLPSGVTVLSTSTYDDSSAGTSTSASVQDLLTAGLGKAGLAGAAPAYASATAPTAAELRRNAIYANYRGLVDISAAGGYGTLYGPNVAADGSVGSGDGKVPGREIIAQADDGSGLQRVGLMVQIPDSFDVANPCIVAAPSSGSRGLYGAIGTAGEWGLKRGCAVAYTDAGKGIGYHDLAADMVNLPDGTLVARSGAAAAAQASAQPVFAADLASDAGQLAAFNAAYPNRIAYKHVHSQQNPEAAWGRNVLDSIRLALWALNERYADTASSGSGKLVRFTAANTVVIASSVSNGGGASLAAAEQDSEGLIDGVAVSEPNAQPSSMSGVSVTLGGAPVSASGKPLIDYFTYRMIYEPCAAISASAQTSVGGNTIRPGWFGAGTAPLNNAFTLYAGQELETLATNRCQSLADKGLISGATTAEQADAALAKLQAYGWDGDDSINALHASHYRLADVYVTYGYVVAYGRFSVADNLCGLSLANLDASGNVAAQASSNAVLFASSNGLNTGGDVIYNDSVGGAKVYQLGVSPSTGRMDAALDAMLCLRSMVTGTDAVSGSPLFGSARTNSLRVQAGMAEVLLSGALRSKPTVIVAGRSDTLLPVNHTARAYSGFAAKAQGSASALRYYEVTNGQHFDGFLTVGGYANLFVPVHVYFNQAMDLMWAHLKTGAALPPSQVVRTTPRGGAQGAAPAISASNVPAISATPATADQITLSASGSVAVPQ